MYSEWATQATLRCPNARDVLQTKGRAQPSNNWGGRFGAWGVGGVTHLGIAYEIHLLLWSLKTRSQIEFPQGFCDPILFWHLFSVQFNLLFLPRAAISFPPARRTTAPGRREVKTPMELSVAAVAAATSAEVLALVGDEGLT